MPPGYTPNHEKIQGWVRAAAQPTACRALAPQARGRLSRTGLSKLKQGGTRRPRGVGGRTRAFGTSPGMAELNRVTPQAGVLLFFRNAVQ